MQEESFKCLSHRAGRLGVASSMTPHGNFHYAFKTSSGLPFPKSVISVIVPLNVTSLAFREIGHFMKCLPLQQYAVAGKFLLLVYALEAVYYLS